MRITRLLTVLIVVMLSSFLGNILAADWPTYRGNNERQGGSAETMPDSLKLTWKREALQAPKPAWGKHHRERVDMVNEVIVANDILYFGSSADDSITALDARTGEQKWQFM